MLIRRNTHRLGHFFFRPFPIQHPEDIFFVDAAAAGFVAQRNDAAFVFGDAKTLKIARL
jgi:hypothetical protein